MCSSDLTGGGGTTGGGGSGVPACTTTDPAPPSTAQLTPANFCAIFLDECTGATNFTIPAGYTTQAMCETSFTALTATQKACRSYHLCNAASMSGAAKGTHCGHAVGMGSCQ